MGYQYGRAQYNRRREGAPSTDEVHIVVLVTSHSATPQGEGRQDPPAHPGGNQGEQQQVTEQPQQLNVQTIPGVGKFILNDLKRLLNNLEGGRVTTTAQAPSPFLAVVRESQLPAGYRNTINDLRFHGNFDPVEFLGCFNIEMDVHQVPDLERCRLLAATFREGAQQWFQKLGPGVITSWEQMQTLFLTQFQAAVKYTPPVTTLASVKQKEGESLTSYFKRFNAESTLAESFKAIEKSYSETKKNDNTHSSKGRAKRRDTSASSDYRRNTRSPNRVNVVNVRREWSPPPNYEKRVSNYTLLAASIDHIFEVNKERVIFKKPDRLTSWKSRDKKKDCEYHESTGHDTHECRHLKDEIEELIKAGYLGE
ncbi:uncharacterized protein LOC141718996 [Apium graveolens]|uniref:uncharacterized protein LOC141718996 n=1 Tax=Apium graveolens TaxID=4045 RepID=UPI003D7A3CD4